MKYSFKNYYRIDRRKVKENKPKFIARVVYNIRKYEENEKVQKDATEIDMNEFDLRALVCLF